MVFLHKDIYKQYFIYILILIFSFLNILLEKKEIEFQKIIKLSLSEEYFVIFNTGIFIFNSNFTVNKTIHYFNNQQIISTNDDSINTIISEIKKDNDKYIICLVKKYLYVYQESNNNLNNYYISKLTESTYSQKGVNYNLVPYSIENNNLYLIISLINEKFASHSIYFLYYNENIQENKLNYEQEKKYVGRDSFGFSGISPFNISCQITPSSQKTVKCFYCREYQQYFSSIYFDLNINNIKNAIQYDIIQKTKYYIIKIKSSISNNNIILACFLGSNYKPFCFIIYSNNSFDEITCISKYSCNNIETFYFSEKNEFVFICKKDKSIFYLLSFNSDDSEKIKSGNCDDINQNSYTINECNSVNLFSVIYNNISNDYNIITDCSFIKKDNISSLTTDEEELGEDDEDDKSDYLSINEEEKEEQSDNYNINKEELENLKKGLKDKDFSNISLSKNVEQNIIDNQEKYLQILKENNITNITSENIVKAIDILLSSSLCDACIGDINIQIYDPNSNCAGDAPVDFGECETILRNYYNISNSSKLKYVIMKIKTDDPNSLHDQIEYEIYNDKNEKLDKSLCKDANIRVFYKINGNSSLNVSSLIYFNNKGVDILDSKDPFFNDICYPYSESGDDIILDDRRSDIYQNYSLCDEGCKYNFTDIENMVIACDCEVKVNTTIENSALSYEEFEDVSLMDSNIGVIVCYQLVFSLKDKLNNIGFWILSILLICFLISLFFLIYHGIKPAINYVFNEMVNYGYLKQNHKMFFDNNNKNKGKDKKENSKNIKKTKIKRKVNNSNKYIIIKKTNNYNLNISKGATNNISSGGIDQNSNIIIKENTKKDIKLNAKNKKKILNLPTGGVKEKKNNNKNKDLNNFDIIIKIKLNNIKNYCPKDSNQTLHNYTFSEATKYDKRSLFKILYIYLLSKQIIFHTFLLKSPLELFPLRLCLFIFMISTDLALNSLLYLNDNISKKYKYSKSLFLLTFSDNITVIIYSTLLCFVLMSLVTKLSSSTNAVRSIFLKEEEKIKSHKKYKINNKRKAEIFLEIEKILKRFKIKVIILIIIEIILMLFFWYFVTAFCHVYSGTQKSWLLDSGLSVLSRWVIEFLFAFLFSKLYTISIESGIYTLYRILLFIYDFR